MKYLGLGLLVVLFCGAAEAQQLPGRYFTPDSLAAQMNNAGTERLAQLYLMGAYDLTQDTGQSCAVRGTTTPQQLEAVFSNYLQKHPDLMHADRTAAGVAAQAFAEYWPCQNQRSQPSPSSGPDAQVGPSAATGPVNINIQVQGAFGMPSGFGQVYRTNVVMPKEFNDNNGHWSLTCERLLSHGSYTGTYEPQKNKIQLVGLDLKGKPQITKCEVFSHDWRAPR